MVRKSNIIPIDISSREYYGLNNSQDIYKGKSFRFSGDWLPNTHYFNDEYIVDFVTHPHVNEKDEEVMIMWACVRNHLSQADSEPKMDSSYWTYVMSGFAGIPCEIFPPKIASVTPGNDYISVGGTSADPTISVNVTGQIAEGDTGLVNGGSIFNELCWVEFE